MRAQRWQASEQARATLSNLESPNIQGVVRLFSVTERQRCMGKTPITNS